MKVEGAFVHCLLKEPIFDRLVPLQKWDNNLPLLLISPAEQMESSSLAASRPFLINPTLLNNYNLRPTVSLPTCKTHGNCSQGSSDNYSSFDCERSKSRHQVQQFWHYHSAHLGSVKSVTVDHFFEKREPINLPECSVSSFPAPWLKSSSTSSSGSIRIPKWTHAHLSSGVSTPTELHCTSAPKLVTSPHHAGHAIPTRKSCQLLSLGALDQSM